MSARDGNRSGMDQFSALSDADVAAVLTGDAPADHQDVADFIAHVPVALMETPRSDVEATHVAAIMAALPRPGTVAHRAPRRSIARRTASAVFGTLAAKVLTVGVAAAVTTGGLAASGNLPSPAQSALSSIVGSVGVNIPTAGDGETRSASGPKKDNHGKDVSEVAHDDSATGRDHGKAVSSAAKDHPKDQDANAPESGKPDKKAKKDKVDKDNDDNGLLGGLLENDGAEKDKKPKKDKKGKAKSKK